MRRFSLKLKLTLLYTFFMLLVTCEALAILFSLSNREVLEAAQSKLERRVQESTEDLRLRSGELQVDNDFYSVTQNVYLSLYDEDMYFLFGKVPIGFNSQLDISDGEMRTIAEGNVSWYVYDMSFRVSDARTVYIRGITSVTEAEESFVVTLRFALILLPGLVLVTAFIGYHFTRRTLLPVKQITRTVQEIRADADLSRRIGLSEQGEKSGDEIYALAETFDQMLSELEEVFSREKQFTSDVSHELRTPVSVILAQCGASLADENLTEAQREQILLIQKKAEEMSAMISQLLFLSRADQGRQPLQRERMNLSELTCMVVEEQQFLAEDKGSSAKIHRSIEPDIYADVDETLYIRMVSNLISNAVYYGGENAEITVELSCSGGTVTGCVKDNGIGISEEDLPHIWERFYRADNSRSEGGRSGLGLPMVKWIVEAHGGTVTAGSCPGKGSTFVFRFPASPDSENASEKSFQLTKENF